MTVTTFNPLAYFEELKAAGVSEQQAKVQADTLNKVLDENLSTKNDILSLQKDILAVEERLTYKLKDLENRLLIRLGGMMATFVSILYVLLRFGH